TCGEVPALLLPARAADALAPLGDASPLARAEVLYCAAPAPPSDPVLEARSARLGCAERKLAAANALVQAPLGAEALGLLRDSLALACRAASPEDPGEDSGARLRAVYERLVPCGALSIADAHALVRAGELARAFGSSGVEPPAPLIAELAEHTRDLLLRICARLHGATPTAASAPLPAG